MCPSEHPPLSALPLCVGSGNASPANEGGHTNCRSLQDMARGRQFVGKTIQAAEIGTRAESVCAHHCVCNPSVSVSLITSNATCEAGRDQNPAKFFPGLGHTFPHLASIRSVV